MADSKITALTAISTVDPAADPLVIVDVSDTSMAASGTTKKITSNQILGAGGTATLASATITGDLTVDTSTLKVDSTNNRVGVNNASPTVALDVVGSGLLSTGLVVGTSATNNSLDIVGPSSGTNAGCQLTFKNGATANAIIGTYSRVIGGAYNESLAFYSNSKDFVFYSGSERLRIASNGVATWSNVGGVAGTAMTLNSTGLIRGGSTADIISVESTTLTNIGNIGAAYGSTTGTYFVAKVGAANGIVELKADARTGAYPPMVFTTGESERMRIDSSGNVIVNTASVATTATDGFLYIPGCAGTPTGTPTAKTGRVPLVVDTTNKKLYFYSGGAWVAAN